MILYTENIYESSKQTFRTNIWVGRDCRIKDEMQNSIVFLYSSKEQFKNKLRWQLHLQDIQKGKILRNTLNKKSIRLVQWKLQGIVEIPLKEPK